MYGRLTTLAKNAPHSVRARLKRLASARDGVVSVEMALISIFLASLAIGAFDFGRFGIEKTRITNAARAGAQFGIQGLDYAKDEPGIKAAVLADSGATEAEMPSSSRHYCACPATGEEPCDSDVICTGGGVQTEYVEVTVNSSVNLMFTYPGIPDPYPISSTSTMRVR